MPSHRGFPASGTLPNKSSKDFMQIDLSPDDYILPVPVPMALCPRSAGKAPTLARHLTSFPMPRSASAESGSLVHPKKLFDELEQRFSKTTTVTSYETPSPMPLNTQRQNEFMGTKAGINKLAISEQPTDRSPSYPSQTCYWKGDSSGSKGSKRSNFSDSESRASITRGHTVSRPKTPVAGTQNGRNRKAISMAGQDQSSSKQATLSSIDLPTNSTLSSYIRSDTPPTSPMEQSKGSRSGLVAAQSCKLPSMMAPTPDRACDASSMAAARLDRLDTIPESKKDESRLGKLFKPGKTLTRPKPARLNLSFNAKSSIGKDRAHRHSVSSLGSLLMPLGKAKRPSIQASSVYSRDTRGHSIIRSPISPAFSEKPSTRPDPNDVGAGNMVRKASSLDLLRSKIDNWNLDTLGYLEFPTSPSLKRALSDLGPRSPAIPPPRPSSLVAAGEGSNQVCRRPIPRIYVGRPSDDIFRDPSPNPESGRVLKRVLDMEVAASMANSTRSLSGGSAPGGADWI